MAAKVWNVSLPFKRSLHLEKAGGSRPYLEIGLYDWSSYDFDYTVLFKWDSWNTTRGKAVTVRVFGISLKNKTSREAHLTEEQWQRKKR